MAVSSSKCIFWLFRFLTPNMEITRCRLGAIGLIGIIDEVPVDVVLQDES